MLFCKFNFIAVTLLLNSSITNRNEYKKFKFEIVYKWIIKEGMDKENEVIFLDVIDNKLSNQPESRITFLVILGALCIPVWQALTKKFIDYSFGYPSTIKAVIFLPLIIVIISILCLLLYVITKDINEKIFQRQSKQFKELSYYVRESIIKKNIISNKN